jgi:hypothetical protein
MKRKSALNSNCITMAFCLIGVLLANHMDAGWAWVLGWCMFGIRDILQKTIA